MRFYLHILWDIVCYFVYICTSFVPQNYEVQKNIFFGQIMAHRDTHSHSGTLKVTFL